MSIKKKIQGSLEFLSHEIKLSGIIIIIFFSIRFFVLSTGIVQGSSMKPTFKDGDFFLVNKVGYLISKPDRYDIVQFIKKDTGEYVIKRIVALPGETLKIEGGDVYVKKREKFVKLSHRKNEYTDLKKTKKQFSLGPKEYFLLGDNRDFSVDSRNFGPVKRDLLIGRVFSI